MLQEIQRHLRSTSWLRLRIQSKMLLLAQPTPITYHLIQTTMELSNLQIHRNEQNTKKEELPTGSRSQKAQQIICLQTGYHNQTTTRSSRTLHHCHHIVIPNHTVSAIRPSFLCLLPMLKCLTDIQMCFRIGLMLIIRPINPRCPTSTRLFSSRRRSTYSKLCQPIHQSHRQVTKAMNSGRRLQEISL